MKAHFIVTLNSEM